MIDPKETTLRLEQDQAQLRGAESAVERLNLEIAQRRKTARAAVAQAEARLAQVRLESRTQPTLSRAAVHAAETALHTAQQEKERLIQSVHPNQRVAAQSAVDEAAASFENAQREYARQADLLQKGYVAGRTAESAKLALDLARVRLGAAKENLDRLDAQFRVELAKAEDQIRQAQAEVTRAKAGTMQDELKRREIASAMAELERARAALSDPEIMERQRDQSLATVQQLRSVVNDSLRQLNETVIRAPIDGIVTKKGLQVGEMATGLSQFSSGSTIVKIENRHGMRVKLDVNEIDVAKLQVGMPAKIEIDSLPNESFQGVVSKIAPASKEAPQGQADAVVRYEVEIGLRNPPTKLRSGMTAKCTVEVVSKSKVLVVPVEYVQKEGSKRYVFLAPKTKDAQPERREIVVGAASGSKLEVLSGLREGDRLRKPKFDGPARQGMMSMGDEEE